MTDIVLLSDERIAAVPVRDCGEPLVGLRRVGELEVDDRQVDPGGWYARVRAADQLVSRADGASVWTALIAACSW